MRLMQSTLLALCGLITMPVYAEVQLAGPVEAGIFTTPERDVQAGERVVSTGVFKMRNNIPVSIDNTLAPETSLSPKPDNS